MTISATIPNHQLRLNHLIDTIKQCLDPVLFAPESLTAVNTLAAQLPLVNFQLFEVRLSDGDPSIDLSVPLTDELLSDRSDWCSTAPWQQILALKRACQINGEFAGGLGANVFWGEFDCDGVLPTIPIPGIFFDVSPQLGDSENKSEFASIVCRAWEILRGKALPKSSHIGIKKALTALPTGVCSTHFGIMLPRLINGTILANSLRLHPTYWQLRDIPSWLKIVGAEAVASEVERVTQEIPQLLGRAIVTVDAGEAVGTRVGMECYATKLNTISTHSNQNLWLEEFLDWLGECSLVSPAKAKALLDWGIKRELSLETSFNPSSLFNYSACHLSLSHLKLVFEPEMGVQAKAYLLAHFIEPKKTVLKQKSTVRESFDRIWESANSTSV